MDFLPGNGTKKSPVDFCYIFTCKLGGPPAGKA